MKEQWVGIVKVLYPWFEINRWSLVSSKITLESPLSHALQHLEWKLS